MDSDDDNHSGSTALGFSVNIGGASYSYFDMNSDGRIELLTDDSDKPTHGYLGYGSIDGLIDVDPSSTYLLAAYDDLDSEYYGYYGYKLFADKAVFYYDTETYADDDQDLLNNFEVILSQSGGVQWNFNYADYKRYDYDLYSGLYFGNTGSLHELARYEIPEYISFTTAAASVPEPTTILLLCSGLIGMFGIKKKKHPTS